MLVADRSKVMESSPVPRLTDRFPVTSAMVTGPAWPLMVVPASGVILIWFSAGWLIVKLTAPLSVRDRLPFTRLAVMLAGTSRQSSDSRAGRHRADLRTGARLRRPWLRNTFDKKLETDIRNLLSENRTGRA